MSVASKKSKIAHEKDVTCHKGYWHIKTRTTNEELTFWPSTLDTHRYKLVLLCIFRLAEFEFESTFIKKVSCSHESAFILEAYMPAEMIWPVPGGGYVVS